MSQGLNLSIVFLRPLASDFCKTRTDIPKGKIFDVARALKTVTVPAPVTIGQVLVDNVADTGVEIIATKNVGVKV